jgi:GH24 family phage-related lysozyme (muramidase)
MSNVNFTGKAPSWHGTPGGNASNAGKVTGTYIGRIKDVKDPEGLGRIKVYIPELVSGGEENSEKNWYTVRYAPPMAGSNTNYKGDKDKGTMHESTAKDAAKYKETGRSYGMWMVPPSLDNQVLVTFINGDINRGVWFAMLPHDGKTKALPAVSAGPTHPNSDAKGKIMPNSERVRSNDKDKASANRPQHDQTRSALERQGLIADLRRGLTNASPFRNTDKHPGQTYGILTPAQHSFMLDDGADGDSGSIRLRSATGHQITMHEEGGFIHVINAAGTAWWEMDAEGNIDFYSGGQFSVRAKKGINFYTDETMAMEAVKDIAVVANKHIKIEACETLTMIGTKGVNITSKLNFDIFASAHLKIKGKRTDVNSGGANAPKAGTPPARNPLPNNTGTPKSKGSPSKRVPEAEPYKGHNKTKGGEPITKPKNTPEPPESKKQDKKDEKKADGKCLTQSQLANPQLSPEGLSRLLKHEGYRGTAYPDGRGYSAGYGTRVDIWGRADSKLSPGLKAALLRGPSEPEARAITNEILQKEYIPVVAKQLKNANGKACITQAQVDALISASYNSPVQARNLTAAMVSAANASPDGKLTNDQMTSIWNQYRSNPQAQGRINDELNWMLSGNPSQSAANPAASLATTATSGNTVAGSLTDQANAITNNLVPQFSPGSNVGLTGTLTDANVIGGSVMANSGVVNQNVIFDAPQPFQMDQYERSYWLTTGAIPPGSSKTLNQLKTMYGAPHINGNNPPYAPTAVAPSQNSAQQVEENLVERTVLSKVTNTDGTITEKVRLVYDDGTVRIEDVTRQPNDADLDESNQNIQTDAEGYPVISDQVP